MNELEKLGKKYGTDKIGKHNYLPFYYNLFKDRKESVKKVLEIGAGEGASLFMWEDFFPNAKIYSGEIEDSRLFKKGRIEVIKCDQASEKDLLNLIKKTGSDIDLIIDDGDHAPKHQVFTCLMLISQLGKEEVYIIEDVASEEVFKEVHRFCFWFHSELEVKEVKFSKRYDDRLIIVRHKNDTL